ncbi:MAG: polysaccharide biosynthesis tyrosine autokinase [Bacteroidales bacterium]|nr:polysaccharide biosynthesis tyrosine autokinase [Bacteroidales bacterium]
MSQKDKSQFFDVKSLFNDYRRHWWWFVISLFLCGAMAVVYVKTHNAQYAVCANVLVSDDNTGSFTAMSGMSDLFGSSANVEDEVYVISSHSVLRDVARNLGIYKTHYVKKGLLGGYLAYPDFPVDVTAESSLLDTLNTTMTFKVNVGKDGKADIKMYADGKKIGQEKNLRLPVSLNTKYGRYTVLPTPDYPKGEKVKTTISISGYDDAAEDLAHSISSDRASRKSNMINLYMRTENTAYGKDVLNEIVDNYNRRGISYKNRQGEKTLEFINDRLAIISGDLSTAEKDIQDYKKDHKITDVGVEASYNMGVRGTADHALVQAETESEIIKMTRDFLRQPGNEFQLVPITSNMPKSLGDAINEYNNLVIKRMEVADNARGNNTALRRLDESIGSLRRNIDTSLTKALETSQVQVREARSRLNSSLSKLGNVPAQEREFLGLKRQQAVKQELYIFLLQRREETAMMIANAIPKGRIIDEAYSLSQPVSVKMKTVLAIALLIGLIVPCLLLYLRRLFRTKFDDIQELRALTDIPVVGEICKDKNAENLVVTPGSSTPTTELFRMVRSSLQFMTAGDGCHTILVTSTRPGEGKSFISVNLAASFAITGKRVVLLGMDIRNPQLGNYLGLKHNAGITNFLADPSLSIDSIIMSSPRVQGCDVILAGPVPPNPSELLSSAAVDKLFAELRERYDYIIIDSAPSGMVSDTLSLGHVADMTLYVTRADYTLRRDVTFVNNLSTDNRLPRIALVLNGVPMRAKAYGYGYGYGKQSNK